MVLKNLKIKTMIREFQPKDFPQVIEIYKGGIASGMATYETQAKKWEEWDKAYLPNCRFVYEEQGQILGWVAFLPTSIRECYKGVVEVSIYISAKYSGNQIGTKLMEHLISESEKQGIWCLYSSIFPQNKASIHLHKKVGFREIGYREKIAKLNGIWNDTVLFERRSTVVGID